MISSKLLLLCLAVPLWHSECLQSLRLRPAQSHSHVSPMIPRKTVVAPPFSRLRLTGEGSEEEIKETKSLAVAVNDLAQSLKPEAQKAKAKSAEATQKSKKIMYSLKSYCCYMLFILYRAYRGAFVLSPAVFRRVYAKLEDAIDSDLVNDNEIETYSSDTSPKVSWRTRVTVSVLAGIVTFSYFLGGALRVVGKFFRTMANTTSAFKSFEAAADELVDSEGRVGGYGKGDMNGDASP
jgi:hypothetical protein